MEISFLVYTSENKRKKRREVEERRKRGGELEGANIENGIEKMKIK